MTVLLEALKKAAAEKKRQALMDAEGDKRLSSDPSSEKRVEPEDRPLVTMAPSQARELSSSLTREENAGMHEENRARPSDFRGEYESSPVKSEKLSEKFTFAPLDAGFETTDTGYSTSETSEASDKTSLDSEAVKPFQNSDERSDQGSALIKSLETASQDTASLHKTANEQSSRSEQSFDYSTEMDSESNPQDSVFESGLDDAFIPSSDDSNDQTIFPLLEDDNDRPDENRFSAPLSSQDPESDAMPPIERTDTQMDHQNIKSNNNIGETFSFVSLEKDPREGGSDQNVTSNRIEDTPTPLARKGLDKEAFEREFDQRISRHSGSTESTVYNEMQPNGEAVSHSNSAYDQSVSESSVATDGIETYASGKVVSPAQDNQNDTPDVSRETDSYNWSLSQIPGYQSMESEEQKRSHTRTILESMSHRPKKQSSRGRKTLWVIVFLALISVLYYAVNYYLQATEAFQMDMQRYNVAPMHSDETNSVQSEGKDNSKQSVTTTANSRKESDSDQRESEGALSSPTHADKGHKSPSGQLSEKLDAPETNASRTNSEPLSPPSNEKVDQNSMSGTGQDKVSKVSDSAKKREPAKASAEDRISQFERGQRTQEIRQNTNEPEALANPQPASGVNSIANNSTSTKQSPSSTDFKPEGYDAEGARPPLSTARGGESEYGSPKLSIQSTQSLATQAYQAYQQGKFEKAKQLYEDALAEDERNLNAMFGLAALAIRNQQLEVATQFYQAILRISPSNLEAQKALVSLENRQKGTDANLDKLKNLAMKMPQDPQIQFAIGNHYAQKKDWLDAQKHFFKAYELAPTSAVYALNLAISLDRIGEYRLAKNYYEKTLSSAATSSEKIQSEVIQQRLRVIDRFLKETP